MSPGSIRGAIDEGVALLGAFVAIVVVVVVFAVKFVIENAVWEGVGQGFEAAGRGDLSLAWGVLGAVATLVAVIALAMALVSWLSRSGSSFRF